MNDDFRSYQRRPSTRESGYHTCKETTGGECLICLSERYVFRHPLEVLTFKRDALVLTELFENGLSIIAFGGFLWSQKAVTVHLSMNFLYEDRTYSYEWDPYYLSEGEWKNLGMHAEQTLNLQNKVYNIEVKMVINTQPRNLLDFLCFDLNTVSKAEFIDKSCAKSFYQKTKMHIPYLYYLDTTSCLSLNTYLVDKVPLEAGQRMVLKSCNRCGRYLPINIDNELKTLSFSLHCKKNTPCHHSTFQKYQIQNPEPIDSQLLYNLRVENNKVISEHGHQLECKACKKFFVNMPLNPKRNPQQRKEDGLRRRAMERLVNHLLGHNLVHYEYELSNGKSFSKYIWNKFERKCFKCGQELTEQEMNLDHTLPLAYLYRLDETATCLCKIHNSEKSDQFPVNYYSEEELERLSRITGLSLDDLHTTEINQQVLELLIQNVVWYYEDFLMDPNYQKIRDGVLTADKIDVAVKRVIAGQVDLVEEYIQKTGHKPMSITIAEK